MEGEEVKLLKITTFNVKNIESNKQFVYKLLRSSDILRLQETWLFNFPLRLLGEMHKSFNGFGKAEDDDNPLPPIQKPLVGMVERQMTLMLSCLNYRKY